MFKTLLSILFFLISISGFSQSEKLNALALKNGCKVVVAPASFTKADPHTSVIENWTPNALIDESFETGWCTPRGVNTDLTFVFELSEDYLIDELVFQNSSNTEYKGLNTKNITIAFSNESKNAGFKKIGNYEILEHRSTSININPQKMRWVMIQIHSNYGNPSYTDLMEVSAHGEYYNQKTEALSVNGLWQSNWGLVSLKENQRGLLYGCYKYNSGSLVSTAKNRRIYNLNWSENSKEESGWAVVVLNAEGNSMNGIWGYHHEDVPFGYCRFDFKNKEYKDCNNDVELAQTKPILDSAHLKLIFHIRDKSTKEPIKSSIRVFDNFGNSYLENTGDNGRCEFIVAKSNYKVSVVSQQFFTYDSSINLEETENLYSNGLEKTFDLIPLTIGANIKVDNLLFQANSSKILEPSYSSLDHLVKILQTHPNMKIEINGHTDNTGTSKANLILSQNRVKEVIGYLKSNGIKSSRLKGTGYGDRFPIASNAHAETRMLNRRVEFKIIKF